MIKIIHETEGKRTVYLDTVCTSDAKRVSSYGVELATGIVRLFSNSIALDARPICGSYQVFPLPAEWFDTYIGNEIDPNLEAGLIIHRFSEYERTQILHTEIQDEKVVSLVVHYHHINHETGTVENLLHVFKEGDSTKDQFFCMPITIHTTSELHREWKQFLEEKGAHLSWN